MKTNTYRVFPGCQPCASKFIQSFWEQGNLVESNLYLEI